MENPIKMDDLVGFHPIFGSTQLANIDFVATQSQKATSPRALDRFLGRNGTHPPRWPPPSTYQWGLWGDGAPISIGL